MFRHLLRRHKTGCDADSKGLLKFPPASFGPVRTWWAIRIVDKNVERPRQFDHIVDELPDRQFIANIELEGVPNSRQL